MTYIYASDLQSFSSSVADSANSCFLQPTEKYSLNVWVQVQCKAATAFPQSHSTRVEDRVGSCNQLRNARRPGESDRRGIENELPDDDSADGGILVSLKVMYGRVESARETWTGCQGNKDPPKV